MQRGGGTRPRIRSGSVCLQLLAQPRTPSHHRGQHPTLVPSLLQMNPVWTTGTLHFASRPLVSSRQHFSVMPATSCKRRTSRRSTAVRVCPRRCGTYQQRHARRLACLAARPTALGHPNQQQTPMTHRHCPQRLRVPVKDNNLCGPTAQFMSILERTRQLMKRRSCRIWWQC